MKIIEINEAFTPYQPKEEWSKKEVDAYIEKNCSDFLAEVGQIPLYRGFVHVSKGEARLPKIAIGASPTHRPPRDSPFVDQKRVDKALKEAGFTALRSNSIFCSGSEAQARIYGRVYLVYPINGFSFTWAYKAPDFFGAIGDKRILQKSGSEIIKHFGFRKDDLRIAVLSGHEIYIHGRYVMIAKGLKGYNENN